VFEKGFLQDVRHNLGEIYRNLHTSHQCKLYDGK